MSRCVRALSGQALGRAFVLAVAAAVTAGCGGGGGGAPSGDDLARLARPPIVPAIASERIYFVLTDRYANGDRSNDRGGLTGTREATGFDPTDAGYYHGGDLRGLTAGLRRIKNLGFTAVWLTPVVKQKPVQSGSAAYHGYWGVDFTTVDPHLGTADDFARFVSSAHRLGMKVYLDVVVNHTADVIFVGGGYSDAPYQGCNGRVFDPARFAGGTRFPCLEPGTMPHAPLLLDADAHAKRPQWLNDVTAYHNRGDIDFESCDEQCFEQGDFFGLDDLFTEQPRVANGLARIYGSWIRRFGVDGFRIDTARHVNSVFFRRWVPQIVAAARTAGVPRFQLFGEIFLTSAVDVAPFVRDRGVPNVLDFPFQDAATNFVSGASSARALAHRLEDDDYFRTSKGLEPVPPTFLGNHDLGRAAQQIKARGGNLTGRDLLDRVLLGYDVLYLLRGAPTVYYGDEVGMVGTGGDKAARQDMFPTRVADWRTEERVGAPPIGARSSFDVEDHPIESRLRKLAALRAAHPALWRGPSIVRLADGPLLVVGRIDPKTRREYVAAFNAGPTAQRVTVRTASAGPWTTLLGRRPAATARRLTLAVPARGSTLVRGGRAAAGPVRTPRLSAGPDELTDLVALRARVPSDAPVTVAFAIRGEGGWRRVAVDDTPPYRAFLDRSHFGRGERVEVLAIARSLGGDVAVSKTVTLTPRR